MADESRQVLEALNHAMREAAAGTPRLVVVQDTPVNHRPATPDDEAVPRPSSGIVRHFVQAVERRRDCALLSLTCDRQVASFYADVFAPALLRYSGKRSARGVTRLPSRAMAYLEAAAAAAPDRAIAFGVWLLCAAVPGLLEPFMSVQPVGLGALRTVVLLSGPLVLVSWLVQAHRAGLVVPSAAPEVPRPERLPRLLPAELCGVLLVDRLERIDRPSLGQLAAFFDSLLWRRRPPRCLMVLRLDPNAGGADVAEWLAREAQARADSWKVLTVPESSRDVARRLRTRAEQALAREDVTAGMAALVSLCELLLDDPEAGGGQAEFEATHRLQALKHLAIDLMERFRREPGAMGSDLRRVLLRTCLLLARIHLAAADDQAVAALWLINAFDLTDSLEGPAAALLLDDAIRPLVAPRQHRHLRRDYEPRVAAAIQRLGDAPRADWGRLGSILRHALGVLSAPSADLAEKQAYLQRARVEVQAANLPNAIYRFTRGTAKIDWENPERVDFDLLDGLYAAFVAQGDAPQATEVAQQTRFLRDAARSRDYLQVAEACRARGWPWAWALRVATHVEYRATPAYQRAAQLLGGLDGPAVQPGPTPSPRGEPVLASQGSAGASALPLACADAPLRAVP